MNKPLVMLISGAMIIGISPILVRLSEIGPVASAFHRLFLAWPWLWLLMRISVTTGMVEPTRKPSTGLVILAGFIFSVDLAFWHGSIMLTSVSNATVLANLAPVFVAFGAWMIFSEMLNTRFVLSLIMGIGGVVLLMLDSLDMSTGHFIGDVLGVFTAVFYAMYLLVIRELRRHYSTWALMTWTVGIAAVLLLPLAYVMEAQLFPSTLRGWMILLILAIGSQVVGQSLITYALAHLPVSFSSLSLLMQPVVATMLAWWLFGENLQVFQWFGMTFILTAIVLARRSGSAVKQA
ncbi:MAG: DMT family transporter [Gammaproteobacteria bacterium]|nr:MAG: DMT family transporter [Gammaproteobacteria bacterium]